MQDANHLNGGSAARAIEHNVPTTATITSNVQGANTGLNLMTGRATRDIGTIVQGG
jgi:hypothetical protein